MPKLSKSREKEEEIKKRTGLYHAHATLPPKSIHVTDARLSCVRRRVLGPSPLLPLSPHGGMAAWPSPETPDGGVLWCDRSSDRGSHDDTATAAAAVNRSTLPPRRCRHVPMHAYLTLVRIHDNDYYTVVGWLLDTRYRYIGTASPTPMVGSYFERCMHAAQMSFFVLEYAATVR